MKKINLGRINYLLVVILLLNQSGYLFGMERTYALQSLVREEGPKFSKAVVGFADKDEMRKKAEDEGYGYKTVNLELLTTLTKSLNAVLKKSGNKYQLGVPAFVGIASPVIKEFLKDKGIDITEQWRALMDKYFPDTTARNKTHQIFKDKKFPEGFFEQVKHDFVEAITGAFDEAKASSDENVLGLPKGKREELDKLITETVEMHKRLMVRSSGKEDTDKLANAGGNETKANVVPKWADVIEAMKEVVLSYFSDKSLIQRLGCGDETLFEEPMTPVLVQRMVGEKPGGEEELEKIPRCGVMFTEEPEGGLSRLHPEDKTKTSGITIIQASYGHNEGVVNSIVPVDTYYVDMVKSIFPVVRPKLFRMIPLAESGKLDRSERHRDDWSYEPALRREEIKILKLLADALEEYYQGPMDVEYVIDCSERKLWIVQARPIVHNPNQPKPSYLKTTELPNKITGEAIGVAGGKVRKIMEAKQCIVRKTIGEALDYYQEANTDRNSVECIVVGQHAPSTSHEATTFRSEVKPVVYVPEWQKVETLLNESKCVIVDVQQGVIAPWDKSETELKALTVVGWVSYPIPAKMSMWKRTLKKDSAKNANDLAESITKKQKMVLDADLVSQLDLVTRNIFYVRDLVTLLKKFTKQDDSTQQARIKQHRLLYEKFIKAATKQQVVLGFTGEIVDGYSMDTFLKEAKGDVRSKEFLEEQGIAGDDQLMMQFIKLKDAALTEALSEQWVDFIKNKVAKVTEDERQVFLHFVYTLSELDALELWLHTDFLRSGGAEASVENILENSWDDNTQRFTKELSEKKKLLKQTDLKGVADPSKFKKVWDDFNKHVIDYFVGDFIEEFEQVRPAGKLAALQVMIDFVAVFDDALKTMSRSKAYQLIANPTATSEAERIKIDKDKGFTFKLMLQRYLQVLKIWWRLYSKLDSDAAVKMNYAEPMSVNDALVSIGLMINFSGDSAIRGQQEADFQASSGYNVAEGVIGSGALWERGQPKTLEDVFTFIHQSLLVIVGALSFQHGLSFGTDSVAVHAVPGELRKIHDVITTFSTTMTSKGGTLLTSSLNRGVLRLFYNWPQRNHSASIDVSYFPPKNRKEKGEVEINLCFFGHNGGARWNTVADTLMMRSYLDDLPIKLASDAKARGVTVSWRGGVELVLASMNKIKEFFALASEIAMFPVARMNYSVHYKNTKPELLSRYLEFWKQQDHCLFLLTDENLNVPFDIARWIIEKWITNERYRFKTYWLFQGASVELSQIKEPTVEGAIFGNLFKALSRIVEQNHWFSLVKKFQDDLAKGEYKPDMLVVARVGVMSSDPLIQCGALELYRGMISFKQLQGIKDVLYAVNRGVASSDERVKQGALELWGLLVSLDQPRVINEAIEVAKVWVVSLNQEIRKGALELWRLLFNLNRPQIINEAMTVAKEGIKSNNPDVVKGVLELLGLLVSLNYAEAINEAVILANTLAKEAIRNDNLDVLKAVVELWGQLISIKKPWVINEAMNFLMERPGSINPAVADEMFKLQQHLFIQVEKMIQNDSPQEIEEAIKMATKGIIYGNLDFQKRALVLWQKLFSLKPPRGISEAMSVVMKGIHDWRVEPEFKEGVLRLWQQLIIQLEKMMQDNPLQGISETMAVVMQGIKGEAPEVQKEVLELWQKLVVQLGKMIQDNPLQGISETVAVVIQGIKSEAPEVQKGALELWQKLVVHLGAMVQNNPPQGVEEATTMVMEGMKSENPEIQKGALALLKKLVIQLEKMVQNNPPQCLSETITVVTKWIKSENSQVKAGALLLWWKLFARLAEQKQQMIRNNPPQGISEAIALVNLGVASNHQATKEEANALAAYLILKFVGIVKVGHNIDEIMDAIINFSKIKNSAVRKSVWIFFRTVPQSMLNNVSPKHSSQIKRIAERCLTKSESEYSRIR